MENSTTVVKNSEVTYLEWDQNYDSSSFVLNRAGSGFRCTGNVFRSKLPSDSKIDDFGYL